MSLLGQYRRNFYSQHGEDGITTEILRRLGLDDDSENRWAVEFGAWDGKYLSNTFFLVEQRKWNAVYIEGDPVKFNDLLTTVKDYPKIVPLQAYVAAEPESENSLENLLKKTAIPKEFDFLSIDIDSYDILVLESIKEYSPKLIIIETNDQYGPSHVFRYSPTPPGVDNPGSTFAAIQESAVKQGYTLVCHTGNSFYVRNDLVSKLNLPQNVIDDFKSLFKA